HPGAFLRGIRRISELVRRRRSHAVLAVSRRKNVVYHHPFTNAEELSLRCWRTYRQDARRPPSPRRPRTDPARPPP
ncbi:unnamed protein product, partial [Ectocarpus sp. 4 AP-2014]